MNDNNAGKDNDVWLYRMIIAALGVTLLVSEVGVIVLEWKGVSAPQAIVALGSAAIGVWLGSWSLHI